MTNEIALEIKNLHKTYYISQTTTIPVLKGISLKVQKGETLILLGSSGEGKSTLLNLLCGLESPSEGSILVNEKEFSTLPADKRDDIRRREMGVIFQFFELHQNLTCQETLELALLLSNRLDSQFRTKITELLGRVELEKRKEYLINQLSRGEKQRIAIARALITIPNILIADEPTGALDEKTSTTVLNLLRNYANNSAKTLIIATHDKSIIKTEDRVLFLRNGKIVEK